MGYIEREAAIKRFSFATLDCLGMEPTIRAADVVAILKSIPAADVVPVRHGRWKPHSKVEVPVFHCSVCGGAALHAFGKQCKSDYCPNCGARMDKDGDGDV